MARGHREYFQSIAPVSSERRAEFTEEAARSLQQQKEIEAADDITFEQYLANYYSAE